MKNTYFIKRVFMFFIHLLIFFLRTIRYLKIFRYPILQQCSWHKMNSQVTCSIFLHFFVVFLSILSDVCVKGFFCFLFFFQLKVFSVYFSKSSSSIFLFINLLHNEKSIKTDDFFFLLGLAMEIKTVFQLRIIGN